MYTFFEWLAYVYTTKRAIDVYFKPQDGGVADVRVVFNGVDVDVEAMMIG